MRHVKKGFALVLVLMSDSSCIEDLGPFKLSHSYGGGRLNDSFHALSLFKESACRKVAT